MKIKTCKSLCRSPCIIAGAVLSLMFLFAGTATAAALYQWKDENGVVHFTDKPPSGKDVTKRVVKSPPLLGEDTGEQETNAETEAQDANAKRCEIERKRLQVLQSDMTVRMRNEDGSVRDLGKEEIQEEIALSQSAIERYCKPADAN